jgi:hypothetical protein
MRQSRGTGRKRLVQQRIPVLDDEALLRDAWREMSRNQSRDRYMEWRSQPEDVDLRGVVRRRTSTLTDAEVEARRIAAEGS